MGQGSSVWFYIEVMVEENVTNSRLSYPTMNFINAKIFPIF